MKTTSPARFWLVVFALTAGASHSGFAQKSDAETLRYLKEVEWPKAYRERDTLLLDRILAPEYQMVASDGSYATKADQLEFIRKNEWRARAFRFVIQRLEVFENGSAIVTGTGYLEGKNAKGVYWLQYQSSNFFMKRNGVWRAVASHTSGDTKLDARPAALDTSQP